MKDEVDMAIKSVTVVPNRLSNNGNEGPIRYRQAVMNKMISRRSNLNLHPEVLSTTLRLLTLTSIQDTTDATEIEVTCKNKQSIILMRVVVFSLHKISSILKCMREGAVSINSSTIILILLVMGLNSSIIRIRASKCNMVLRHMPIRINNIKEATVAIKDSREVCIEVVMINLTINE